LGGCVGFWVCRGVGRGLCGVGKVLLAKHLFFFFFFVFLKFYMTFKIKI